MNLGKQLRKERARLEQIPLFSPLFQKAHGREAIWLSLGLGVALGLIAVWYFAPWSSLYDGTGLRLKMWIYSFAAVIAAPCIASYIIEFILRLIDLFRWLIDMKLRLNLAMKVFGGLVITCVVAGAYLYSNPAMDVWGIYSFGLSVAFLYLCVSYSWSWNYVYHQAVSHPSRRERKNKPASADKTDKAPPLSWLSKR